MSSASIDAVRLTQWLDATLPGPGAPAIFTQVEGGASHLIYRVERGGQTFALRRPAAVQDEPTSNTFRRELRLLAALSKSAIPHARLIAACEDTGLIGVPFALLRWMDGFALRDPRPEGFDTQEAARSMAEELIDGLVAINIANWQAMGLEGFGAPEDFLARQVDQSLAQLERARSRDLPNLERLSEWLRANPPATQRVTLIHGNYQFKNVMFARAQPPRLQAIMDWESATIGDPLLDLGLALAGWQEEGEPPSHASTTDWRAFPPRKEMALRYAQRTSLRVTDLNYYMALALFKLAATTEDGYFRTIDRQSTQPADKDVETAVPLMLAKACRFAEGG